MDFKSDDCRLLSHTGKWIRHAACTTTQSQRKTTTQPQRKPTTQPQKEKKQSAGERKLFFENLHHKLSSCLTFQQLSTLSKAVKPEINSKFSLKVKKLTIQEVQGELDATAAALHPEDGTLGLFPMKVGADGNCCPRALSVLAYGTEDYHL